GMPGISDPGYEIVAACAEAGIPVIPIPGPSAAITALSASGLPTDRFIFEGFLPTKEQSRRERLEALQSEPRTLIFYEAPHRLLATLEAMSQIWGADRKITLARELTKLHEEFWRGTLEEAIDHYQTREALGEFTLVVAGRVQEDHCLSETVLKQELLALINQGLSRSQASRELAQQTSLSRRELYQLALSLEIDQATDQATDSFG
ncbi:MAG: 16S rRNA (cytidine(1402)-2'-O)-methyltransferase, partial [Leptolyngbyaceae cyanobacterium bins.59]|nr:16S rRNA (cytidine(1402)-2'-O)-methyltransferase [Leptolyngbyaceae cyanobacterium bins.59]